MSRTQLRGSTQIKRKSITLDRLKDVVSFTVRVLEDANNVTLSGNQTIDGVSVNDGDLVACFGQTTVTEDGIYVVDTNGAWTRSHLAEVGYDLSGHSILVTDGTKYSSTLWGLTNTQGHGIVGSDDLIPIQLGGSGSTGASNGLSVAGSNIELGGDLTKHTHIYMHGYNLDIAGGGFNFESASGNRFDNGYYSGHSGMRLRNSSGSLAIEILDNALPNGVLFRFGADDVRLNSSPTGNELHAVADVAYVHSILQGRFNTVRAMADSNVSNLSGTQTIDGVSLNDGDKVFCPNQTTSTEDGIYIVRTGAWERASEWETGDSVGGITVTVMEGTNYGDNKFLITNDTGHDIIGTDDIQYVQLTGAGSISAGDGLYWTGNTLNLGAADNSITVNADDIQVKIGNTNGDSLEVSTTGLELRSNITGNRVFSNGTFDVNSGSGNAVSIVSGDTLTMTGANGISIGSNSSNTDLIGQYINFADNEVSHATNTNAIPFAVTATTDYGNGNGTNPGDVVNQFRSDFTDDAIINALVELKALINNAVNADNGLSVNSGVVELGGQLTKTTLINMNNHNMSISDGHLQILPTGGAAVLDVGGSGHPGIRIRNAADTTGLELYDSNLSTGAYFNFASDDVVLANSPTGTVPHAVVDVAYIDSLNSQETIGEIHDISSNTNTITLNNASAGDGKNVTKLRLFVNGARQAEGAGYDYTFNADSGVVTFTYTIMANAVVVADYVYS